MYGPFPTVELPACLTKPAPLAEATPSRRQLCQAVCHDAIGASYELVKECLRNAENGEKLSYVTRR
jgi:hypothetical protein